MMERYPAAQANIFKPIDLGDFFFTAFLVVSFKDMGKKDLITFISETYFTTSYEQ